MSDDKLAKLRDQKPATLEELAAKSAVLAQLQSANHPDADEWVLVLERDYEDLMHLRGMPPKI